MPEGIIDNVTDNATDTEMEEFKNTSSELEPVKESQDNIEKQLKDTKAAYTQARQEIAALKTHIGALEEAIANNKNIDIPPEVQRELDQLKVTNPELWRQKLNAIENKRAKDLSSSISRKTEIARRQAVLEEWNHQNADAQINEYIVNNVLPAGLYNKLKNSEVTFEGFLAEASNFLRQTKMGPGNSEKAGKKDPMTSTKGLDVGLDKGDDISYEDLIL